MRPDTAYGFVVFATALSLSTVLWFGPLYFTGGISENLASVVLFELPFILFCYPMVNGSRVASLATGVLMGVTALLWIQVFDVSAAGRAAGSQHILSTMFLALVAGIVLIKLLAFAIALFSPGFRTALGERRERKDDGIG